MKQNFKEMIFNQEEEKIISKIKDGLGI